MGGEPRKKLRAVVGWRLRTLGSLTAEERESLDRDIQREQEEDKAAGRSRTWEEIAESLRRHGDPIPQPISALAPVLAALARMGRDANGNLLHSERTSWLDEQRVRDPDERELFHHLFDQAEAERAVYQQEQRDELERQRESARR